MYLQSCPEHASAEAGDNVNHVLGALAISGRGNQQDSPQPGWTVDSPDMLHGVCLDSMAPRLWLCILVAILLVCLLGNPCQAIEVTVYSSAQLREALSDAHVTEINVIDDIALNEQQWAGSPYPSEPIPITRNVTLQSVPPLHALDLRYLRQRLQLAPGVHFALNDFVLVHSRYGSGIQLLDILAASPSSTLLMSGITLRDACVPDQKALEQLLSAARPPEYPGEQQATKLATPLCYNGTCNASGVVHQDIALHPSLTEDPNEGGYTVVLQNFTRACLHIVSEQCVAHYGGEACTKQYLKALSGAPSPGSQPDAVQGPNIAGVAAGVAAGGAVLLSLVGLAAWLLQRRRLKGGQQRQGQQPGRGPKLQVIVEGAATGPITLTSPESYMKSQLDQAPTSSSWHITATNTTDDCMFGSVGSSAASSGNSQPSQDLLNAVQLGPVVGVGSFARVYRGHWMGHTVAVKVLHHNSTKAQGVMSEASLMLSLKHPHVVRAYHVISWQHRPQQGRCSVQLDSSSSPSESTPPSAVPQQGVPTAGSEGAEPGLAEAQTWLIQEYCDGGSLANLFVSRSRRSLLQQETPDSDQPGTQTPSPRPLLPQQQQQEAATASTSQRPGQQQQEEGGPRAPRAGRQQQQGQPQQQGQHQQQGHLPPAGLVRRPPDLQDPQEQLKLLCRLREVAQAMHYLHSCHVVHGDLKLANVLLASDPAAPYGQVAKVTDFGISRCMQAGQTHRSTRTLGTVSHMSPELLRLGRMSSAADVYAFAIMMWEMVTGRLAFTGMHYGEVVERVGIQSERPPIPPEVPEDYALLMRSCWEELPGARPSFQLVEQTLATMIRDRQPCNPGGSRSGQQGGDVQAQQQSIAEGAHEGLATEELLQLGPRDL